MTQFTNYSQTIGLTPVQIWPTLSGTVSYMRLWNVSASGGPTIWLTRYGSSPAANTPGSFPLQPGEFEEFEIASGFNPPLNSVWAIATAAGAELTAEVGS